MPRKATKPPISPKAKPAAVRPPKAAHRTKSATARRSPPATTPAPKSAAVLAALGTAAGATLPELMALTGWQAHSVRGFLSGTVRRKLGLDLSSEASAEGRRYRVTRAASS